MNGFLVLLDDDEDVIFMTPFDWQCSRIMFWQCLSVGCYKLSPGVVTVWVWPDWLSHCLSWLGCHGLEHYVTPSRTSNLQHLPSLLLSHQDSRDGVGSDKAVGLRRFFLYFYCRNHNASTTLQTKSFIDADEDYICTYNYLLPEFINSWLHLYTCSLVNITLFSPSDLNFRTDYY